MAMFPDYDFIRVHFPTESELRNWSEIQRGLFVAQAYALKGELGVELVFDSNERSRCADWYVGPIKDKELLNKFRLEPTTGPRLYLNRNLGLLLTDGTSISEVGETYSYLRSLRGDGELKIDFLPNFAGVIDKITEEVATSYPAFELRGLDWSKICERHIPRVESAEDKLAALQCWLAELQDAHTWVREWQNHPELRYRVYVEKDDVRFYEVEQNSIAWRLGVRNGDRLIVASDWLERTAATKRQVPLVAGRRLLSSPTSIHLCAELRDGRRIEWEESTTHDLWSPTVETKRINKKIGYMRIRAFQCTPEVESTIESAFQDFQDCEKLIIDLRHCPGGNLQMAHKFRDRFVEGRTLMGYIHSTDVNGKLGEKQEMWAEPQSGQTSWHKRVDFLIDRMTYSAAEDATLGLQGLNSRIRFLGEDSGGGSGRIRILRLHEGYKLMISTALTYDRGHRCIEGSGIPVDVPIKVDYKTPIEVDRVFVEALKS